MQRESSWPTQVSMSHTTHTHRIDPSQEKDLDRAIQTAFKSFALATNETVIAQATAFFRWQTTWRKSRTSLLRLAKRARCSLSLLNRTSQATLPSTTPAQLKF